MGKIKDFFRNKRVLVIGGTGSWGSELVKQLIKIYKPLEIRIFSRGEHKQVEMRHTYKGKDNIRFIIGDVRNPQAVNAAMQDIDIVFNLAALKHVPVCEENVWEAILTNVYGVHNIIQAAMKHEVEVVVQVSTDKAVDPLNLYGFTKGCAEKLITSANNSLGKRKKTRFVCVRGGNVLSTTGSVVPFFKYLLATQNRISITHKDMSRYFMRLSEAISLVLKATVEAVGGEIFVMKMPSAKITDLADVMVDTLGNKKTQIEYIGIRAGEKLYETLVSKNESPHTVVDGKYYVILPNSIHMDKLTKKYKSFKKIDMEEYTSRNTTQLDKKGILQLLQEDGWLQKEVPRYILFPYMKGN